MTGSSRAKKHGGSGLGAAQRHGGRASQPSTAGRQRGRVGRVARLSGQARRESIQNQRCLVARRSCRAKGKPTAFFRFFLSAWVGDTRPLVGWKIQPQPAAPCPPCTPRVADESCGFQPCLAACSRLSAWPATRFSQSQFRLRARGAMREKVQSCSSKRRLSSSPL